MIYYMSIRLLDGKPRKVIVDETGKIVNRSPNKEELKGIEKEQYIYNQSKRFSNETLLDCLKRFKDEKLVIASNDTVPKTPVSPF